MLACRMWVYWQCGRVEIEHTIHARELDLLVKDDSVRRDVAMVRFFKLVAQYLLNDLHST